MRAARSRSLGDGDDRLAILIDQRRIRNTCSLAAELREPVCSSARMTGGLLAVFGEPERSQQRVGALAHGGTRQGRPAPALAA
jgi:hypothetical protein